MIYDFYGFPDELSQVQYPAPSSPELAEQVQSLLQPENVELNPTRGFDHGAWAVLKYLYPDADIPVVQLSLKNALKFEDSLEEKIFFTNLISYHNFSDYWL